MVFTPSEIEKGNIALSTIINANDFVKKETEILAPVIPEKVKVAIGVITALVGFAIIGLTSFLTYKQTN